MLTLNNVNFVNIAVYLPVDTTIQYKFKVYTIQVVACIIIINNKLL